MISLKKYLYTLGTMCLCFGILASCAGGAGSDDSTDDSGNQSAPGLSKFLNTTWVFDNTNRNVGNCPDEPEHYKKNNDDNNDPTCTDKTIKRRDDSRQIEPVSTPQSDDFNKTYLRIDSNGNVVIGKVTWKEEYDLVYDNVPYLVHTECSTGAHTTEEQPATYRENERTENRVIGIKSYTPIAKGFVKSEDKKVKFEFNYKLYSNLSFLGSTFEKTWVNDAVDVSLLKSVGLYDEAGAIALTAEFSGSGFKFAFEKGTENCNAKIDETGTQCTGQIPWTRYSNWSKFTYDEAMMGPEHDPETAYKDFKKNGWSIKPDYNSCNYLSFKDTVKIKIEQANVWIYNDASCLKELDQTQPATEYKWSVGGSGKDRFIIVTKAGGSYECYGFKYDGSKPEYMGVPKSGATALSSKDDFEKVYIPVKAIIAADINLNDPEYGISSKGNDWYSKKGTWTPDGLNGLSMIRDETRLHLGIMKNGLCDFSGWPMQIGKTVDGKYCIYGSFYSNGLSEFEIFTFKDTKSSKGLEWDSPEGKTIYLEFQP